MADLAGTAENVADTERETTEAQPDRADSSTVDVSPPDNAQINDDLPENDLLSGGEDLSDETVQTGDESTFNDDRQIEHDLLREARTGDFIAYEDLHARLEPAIGRFVRRLIGDTAEAEDAIQDTFISFYMNMDRIEPVENLRPYLFRIARNRCYDALRRQGRYEQVSLDDEPTSIRVSFALHEKNMPEDTTHWLLLYMEVQQAMDQLPELQRQSLILYAEEEMSYAEVAEVMEVSIGTVKSRLYHAKAKLRGLLPIETLQAIGVDLR